MSHYRVASETRGNVEVFVNLPQRDTEVGLIIGRDYLLKKPSGPSAPKLFLDTQIVPLAVNVAGGLEVALDRASARTGVRPALILAGITGLLSFALFRLLRNRGMATEKRHRQLAGLGVRSRSHGADSRLRLE